MSEDPIGWYRRKVQKSMMDMGDECIYPSCYLGSHSCPDETHCDDRIEQLQRSLPSDKSPWDSLERVAGEVIEEIAQLRARLKEAEEVIAELAPTYCIEHCGTQMGANAPAPTRKSGMVRKRQFPC